MARKSPNKSVYIATIAREFAEQVQIQEVALPEKFDAAIEEGMDGVQGQIIELLQEEKYWESCVVLYHAFKKNMVARLEGSSSKLVQVFYYFFIIKVCWKNTNCLLI